MSIRKTLIISGLVVCNLFAGGTTLYEQGAGLFQADPTQALELFEQAAGEGNVSAMVGAGHCYETGEGTEVDYAKAIEFYELAVKHKSLKACEGLGRIYASCPDPKFHDGEKAVKFASVVVRKNKRDAGAYAELAAAYARNLEFDRAESAILKANATASSKEYKTQLEDYRKGKPYPEASTDEWIDKAALSGSEWALRKCAEKSHRAGDFSQSRLFYEKLREQRSPEDNVQLGLYYIDGIGGDEDIQNAIILFKAAVQQGSEEACRELGFVYFFGKGGRNDVDMTLRYFDIYQSRKEIS